MSRTPDESRALGLYVNVHPERRSAVAAGGWDALTPDQQEEAAALFREEWGRGMEE